MNKHRKTGSLVKTIDDVIPRTVTHLFLILFVFCAGVLLSVVFQSWYPVCGALIGFIAGFLFAWWGNIREAKIAGRE